MLPKQLVVRKAYQVQRFWLWVLVMVGLFFALQVLIIYPAISYPEFEYINEEPQTFAPELLSKYPLLVDYHDHHGVEKTEVRTCKLDSGDFTCVVTKDTTYTSTNISQAILFYGTDIKLAKLPLPRHPQHVWTLMHEESPKNNIIFSFRSIMELFNYTSTFRRESNLPLTTQYIRNIPQLESTHFVKTFQQKNRFIEEDKLAQVIYVQGDCKVPSDRDNLVKMMMKYLKIDSYGECLHNKDLPKHLVDPIEGMTHPDFLQLVSKYKFAIAMENGICKDYITEKFWRPLVVGTIPIVLGSPSIGDLAPSNSSIIDVSKYGSVKELVEAIEKIGRNEKTYNSYRSFKRPGGVTNSYLRKALDDRGWEPDTDVQINRERRKPNFPELYACRVCEMMHNVTKKGMRYQASVDHYGCPWPTEFASESNLKVKVPFSDMWHAIWKQTSHQVNAWLNVTRGGRVKASAIKFDKLFRANLQADSA